MTFSEQKVVDLINKEFVPVWESVAPVTVATYKLDEDREVKGTINGEIALYFCRPDGKVFDILPALQSPAETLQAMQDALALYKNTGGARKWQDVRHHHMISQLTLMTQEPDAIKRGEAGLAKRNTLIGDAATPSTKDLRVAIGSKSAMVAPAERFITVEPGGKNLYRYRVHQEFTSVTELRTPEEWKKPIFEKVLEMPLIGHTATYDTDSLKPFTIIEE